MKAAIAIALVVAGIAGCAKQPELLDTTRGHSAVCPVHSAAMTKKEITIIRGHPAPEKWAVEISRLAGSLDAFRKEETDLFPFSGQPVFGSDEIDENSATRAVIFECPRCIQAFAAWQEKQQANSESCVTRSRHTTLVEQAPGVPETKAKTD